jgi:hypothetical protein
MAYKYDKLIGRIIEKFGSRRAFAAAMHMTGESLSKKLNNHRCFDQREITLACKLLDIQDSEVSVYFFTLEVQSA